MNSSRFLRTLVLLLVFVTPTLFAAEDLSGKWGGSFVLSGENEDTAHMVAKQAGAELTGTIGPNADQQFPILKGKVETTKEGTKETTKVTFDVAPNGAEGPQMHFTLTLVEGHLKGSAKGENNGETMSAVIDMARIKN